ncbi:MAG: ABC transporter ATP-binding protein [Deltaproteobacteria bacterium RBG_13_51_10]|nr:MAG: ABC transporter ATP-binding protein [Deltaproteobacteria bacterium RBG_13_51_10]
MLELKEIHTYYGLSHVIQGVSLTVEEGEIITLIGRNGAGKTTTLKSIIGLTPPRAGTVTFRGEDITHLPTHLIAQRGIAFVPEERRVIPNLSVAENLKIGMLKNRDKSKNSKLLERTFSYFPRLQERLTQRGGSLSGGEQQMLTMARGLVSNPAIMLIDEPTEGLMPLLVNQIAIILKEMNKDGVTILLVEQNVEMALSISTRGYVIDQGVIQFEGQAKELQQNREIQQRYLGV